MKILYEKSLKNDPIIEKFLARVPPETAKTFTDTQLAEIKRVFSDRLTTPRRVDLRLSIPFFKRRFYLVLLIGKEKRSKSR